MLASPVTNVPFQWPPATPTFPWPGPLQYPPAYHQYHNSNTMSSQIPASHRPSSGDLNQTSSRNGEGPNRPRPREERTLHQTRRTQNSQPLLRVSQAKMSSLLDWLKYSDDNTTAQAPARTAPLPNMNLPNLYPASLPPPPQYTTRLKPQATAFQPTSRYNLPRRTDSQLRPYSSQAPDPVIQSIEPRDNISTPKPTLGTPPWRQRCRHERAPLRVTPSRDEPERSVTPPPKPVVSRTYLSRANAPPRLLSQPQKLLVVLDLNGTLLAREKGNIGNLNKIKRPGVGSLLKYLFDNHVVMVCTSATLRNAEDMVRTLLTREQHSKLVTIRARNTFGLTKKQYQSKVQIYKNLEDIWIDPLINNAIPQGAAPWSMANTVLIDDSITKASAQPHSLIQVPEFEYSTISGSKKERSHLRAREEAIMKSVQEKLEKLKWQANIPSLIRQWQEGKEDAPGIVDDKVDQGQGAALKDTETETGTEDYPRPTSLEHQTESEDDYELPEQVELVFRGRAKAAPSQPTLENPKTRQEDNRELGPPEHMQHKSSHGLQAEDRRRSPSPVTADHFQWLKNES